MLERGKRTIYLSRRDTTQTRVEVFLPPIEVSVKKMPIRVEYLLERLGAITTDVFVAKVPYRVGAQFSVGDRCFVKRMPPSMHDPSCNDADFKVSAITEGAEYTDIIMEGMV